MKPNVSFLLLAAALVLMHGLLAVLPGIGLSLSLNAALLAVNLYAGFCGWTLALRHSGRSLALFVVGYLVLFVLLVAVLDRKPLFIVFVVLYASVFRSPFLLGAFALFVLSFIVLQPYAIETFLPLLGVYVAAWRVRRASAFVRGCLIAGLLALALCLLPLLSLVLQDSAQTLWYAALRPDVQAALSVSIASSTIATLIVTAWGVPLAYALARLDFHGKRLVETLIDLPILVPQSVVGIALIVMLGPGSTLGQALDRWFGVAVAGRFLGLVVAQVFVASPFLIKTAVTAFEGVPPRLEAASRTLGASAGQTFWRVALPLASRGVMVGMVLAWARAVSEFGAVALFASVPVSAPVLVHTEFLRAGVAESRPIAVLLLIVCLWLFALLHLGQSLLPAAWRRPAPLAERV